MTFIRYLGYGTYGTVLQVRTFDGVERALKILHGKVGAEMTEILAVKKLSRSVDCTFVPKFYSTGYLKSRYISVSGESDPEPVNRRYILLEFINGTGVDKFMTKWAISRPRDLDRGIVDFYNKDITRAVFRRNLEICTPKPDWMVGFMYDLLMAIKFIHSKNMIHNDLHTGNFMVGHDSKIKILDFGLTCEYSPRDSVNWMSFDDRDQVVSPDFISNIDPFRENFDKIRVKTDVKIIPGLIRTQGDAIQTNKLYPTSSLYPTIDTSCTWMGSPYPSPEMVDKADKTTHFRGDNVDRFFFGRDVWSASLNFWFMIFGNIYRDDDSENTELWRELERWDDVYESYPYPEIAKFIRFIFRTNWMERPTVDEALEYLVRNVMRPMVRHER